jgi:hypothetical protein
MSLYRELRDALPYDPAEREGVFGARRADEPQITRWSLALGAAVGIALAVARVDWGAALFCGLGTAVFSRALALAWHHLAGGGWRQWLGRELNVPAADGISAGVGLALWLLLVSGGGGVGPAFAPVEAALAGVLAGLITRGVLTVAKWP